MDNINEIPPEEFERIERYLTHNMDEKELHDFKQSLVDDEQLRRNTEEIQLLLTGIQESAIEEKLKEFHKEITATAPVSAPVRKMTFFKENFDCSVCSCRRLLFLLGYFFIKAIKMKGCIVNTTQLIPDWQR